jgi:hypothetical protein
MTYYFCVLLVGYSVKFQSRHIILITCRTWKSFTEKEEEVSTKFYIKMIRLSTEFSKRIKLVCP